MVTQIHYGDDDIDAFSARCDANTWLNFRWCISISEMHLNSFSLSMSSGSLVKNWASWMKSILRRMSSYKRRIPVDERESIFCYNALIIMIQYIWWCIFSVIQTLYNIGWHWGLYENILHVSWMIFNEPGMVSWTSFMTSAVYSHTTRNKAIQYYYYYIIWNWLCSEILLFSCRLSM